MGLYFNDDEHPYIFKSEEEVEEANQSIAQVNEWSELLEEQKKINTAFRESFHDLNKTVELQGHTQRNQWRKIAYRLNDMRKYDRKHAEFNEYVKEQLAMIEEKNSHLEEMLRQERQFKQEVRDQFENVRATNKEIEQRLEKIESAQMELLSKLTEHHQFHHEMAEEMEKQEERHEEVISRLDNQEALTEKILRQVTNLRSILFERANHLAEKIESSYRLTSTYMYKLMTGSVQPLQLFLTEQKEKEKEEMKE